MGLYSDDEDDEIEIKQSKVFDLKTTPSQVRANEDQRTRIKLGFSDLFV